MPPTPVDDAHDPRLADYVDLRDPGARRVVENRDEFFIAEGALVIEQLLRSGYRVRSVLVTPTRLRALDRLLAGIDAPVYVASQEVMNEVAGFNIHRGAVASADRRPLPDPDAVLRDARLVALLEGVTDTENMGALFRNAAAFGVDAVLLSPTCCDPLYRRSVRVSMGHVLRVPFTRLAPWPEALAAVRARGFTIVALTPRTEAEPLRPPRTGTGDRVAVLLGAEGSGLSGAAMAAADRCARIPMAPGVDSLNVATAAAVAFYELARPSPPPSSVD